MLSPKSVAGLTIYDSIICDHMIVSIVPTVRQHTHFMLYFADDSREIAESFIKKIEENSGIKLEYAADALRVFSYPHARNPSRGNPIAGYPASC